MREFDPSLGYPALSVRQPWATAIINHGKDVENRDWRTNFRGFCWLHTGKKSEPLDYDLLNYLGKRTGLDFTRLNYETGGIVGLMEIYDCVDKSESPWFMGEYGFLLRNIEPVEFFPCRGALKFFQVKG